MRTNIKATRTTLSPSLRAYINAKIIAPLQKLLKRDESVMLNIEIELITAHHRKGQVWSAEANVTIGKRVLRAECVGEDAHAVIDGLEEEITREVKKEKDKHQNASRRGARNIKAMLHRRR